MKNIYLTEAQIVRLNDNIDSEKKTFSPSIYGEMENTEFDFMDTKVVNKMLSNRYDEILSYFSDDITKVPIRKVKNKYNKILNICIEKERSIRHKLETLCYNVIVDTFGIPQDEIDFKFELKDTIDNNKQFHVSPNISLIDKEYENTDEIHQEREEIKKRKAVNLLVQGGASRIFDSIRDKYLAAVFELDEDLPRLYSKLMKINAYLLFNESVKIDDKHKYQAGFSEVILGDTENKSKINVEAVVFPILLHESIKGLFELFGTHCLPTDNIKLSKEIMDLSDTLQLEPMNTRVGPILWDYIFDKCDSRLVPFMFNKLVMLDTDKFNKYMEEIEYQTKIGKEIVVELKTMVDYASEYEKFKNDLMQKKIKNDVLTDNYIMY